MAAKITSASSIEYLHLSAMAFKRLRTFGVDTVGELVEHTESELAEAGLNARNVADVKSCLGLVRMTLSPPRVNEVKAAIDVHTSSKEHTATGVPEEGACQEWLAAPSGVRPEDMPALDDISQQVFGRAFGQRRAAKPKSPTSDDARALKFTAKRERTSPRRDDPDDAARIEDIRNKYLMDAVDAAWVLGVSIDLVYKGCRDKSIPSTVIGKRYRVITAKFFEMLGI